MTPETLQTLERGAAPRLAPTPRTAVGAVGDPLEDARRHDQIYRHTLAGADALAGVVSLIVCSLTLASPGVRWPAVLVAPVVVLLAKVAGLYDHDDLVLHRSTLDEVPQLFQLATLLVLIEWLASGALFRSHVGPWPVVLLWALLMSSLIVGRALARAVVRAAATPERCMLVGRGETWDKLRRSLEPHNGAEMVAHFRLRSREGGRYEPLSKQLSAAAPRLEGALRAARIHRVIIALDDAAVDDTLDGILLLKNMGVKVSYVPHMPEVLGSTGDFEDVDGMQILGIRSIGLTRSSAWIKRALDLSVSLAALVVLSPVILLAALAVRLTSRGPVLFRQERVGLHDEVFTMYKFRTMYERSDELRDELRHLNESNGLFKITNDPRITRAGRFLRRTSLDELPQLINVLRGEMSLVGPRPLVLEEDAKVSGWARRRLDLTPGMTGDWQVRGSTRVPLSEMVKLDYLYIANWSLWGDLKALIRTLPHVLGRRGV